MKLFFSLENHSIWLLQGLVLGPLLFKINDFPGSVDNLSNLTIYTDDTSILIPNKCYEELYRIFNDVLYNSLKWFQVNQLVLIMEKTKTVTFSIAHFQIPQYS
jgi:hypothetical protein